MKKIAADRNYRILKSSAESWGERWVLLKKTTDTVVGTFQWTRLKNSRFIPNKRGEDHGFTQGEKIPEGTYLGEMVGSYR